MKKNLVCQEELGHRIRGAVSVIITSRKGGSPAELPYVLFQEGLDKKFTHDFKILYISLPNQY